MVPGQEAQQHQQEWLQLQLGTGEQHPCASAPGTGTRRFKPRHKAKGQNRNRNRKGEKGKTRTDGSQAGCSQFLQGRTCTWGATLQVTFTASFTRSPAFRNLRKCPNPVGHSSAPSPPEFLAARKPSAGGVMRGSGLEEPRHCPGCRQSPHVVQGLGGPGSTTAGSGVSARHRQHFRSEEGGAAAREERCLDFPCKVKGVCSLFSFGSQIRRRTYERSVS